MILLVKNKMSEQILDKILGKKNNNEEIFSI